jgi:hypothetical protein
MRHVVVKTCKERYVTKRASRIRKETQVGTHGQKDAHMTKGVSRIGGRRRKMRHVVVKIHTRGVTW